jgi:hypothetical protein
MRIVVAPQPMEYGLHRDAYPPFIEALAGEGIDAQIELPIEFRGGLHVAGLDLALYVQEHVPQVMLDLLVLKAVETLGRSIRRGKRDTRRMVIFGPNGEVLREVDVPTHEPPVEPPAA